MKKRGRPKSEVSKKKEDLLRVGAQLFRQFGFEKVRVDEICKKSGTSKMTFYRHFEDKVDLALAVLEKRSKEVKATARRILDEEIPFAKKFQNILKINEQFAEELGLRFIEDFSLNSDHLIQKGLKNLSKKMKKINIDFVEMGKSQGFLNSSFNSELILFLAEKVGLILKDPYLARVYPNFSERAKMIEEFFYYGVTEKSPRP